MTCAELEVLLCDYLDGTLPPAQRNELEVHLATCNSCVEFHRDVTGARAFLETVAPAEPPRELVVSILQHIPVQRVSWWHKIREGWLLQPRFVLGAAMTVLSISMFASLLHFQPKNLSTATLDPEKVWQSLDDRTYKVWDRTVKYYDNNPLVMDLQSQWRDLNNDAGAPDPGAPGR